MATRRTRLPKPEQISKDSQLAAQAAGLRYIESTEPGFSRRRRGKGFSYHDPDGNLIKDDAIIDRINSLVIPPAWQNVWICQYPQGHLQATGYDARGRKQYRYHSDWHAARDAAKFARMLDFGAALPAIRKQLAADLRKTGLPREKVLATVVTLLERSLIRVGNDEYARKNHTYGLTTIRDKHVSISKGLLQFRFRGKSGVKHDIDIQDPKLAKIVQQCRDLPGYELFQYLDDEGNRYDVKSHHVNEYLQTISGQSWTAKDFRTWAGTVQMLTELRACEPCETAAQARKCINEHVEKVADRLGNTPAVCRKSYIHPLIMEYFIAQKLHSQFAEFTHQATSSRYELPENEAALMHLLMALDATAAQ